MRKMKDRRVAACERAAWGIRQALPGAWTGALRLSMAIVLSILVVTFTGCGSGLSADTSATPAADKGPHLQGVVHGGQQPVALSAIQIWQVGTTGYGKGATPLIPAGSYFVGGAAGCVPSGSQVCYPGVVTTAGGTFGITNDYSCTPGAEMYITATGGQAIAGTNNSAIALMLGFGPCGPSNASASIVINEVTTVASAYALAAFLPATPAANPSNVGTSASNAPGLVNAFNDIQTLVNIGSGNANLSTATITLPTQELNALGNIIAVCINSATAASANCNLVFGATPNADGSTPSDTFSAALNIARNPMRNVGTLLAMPSGLAPFLPSISAASDLTLAATYTGSGILAPSSLAVDGAGNVWVANAGTSAASTSVTELTHTGTALSGATGFVAGSLNQPSAIAIDGVGDAWIANAGNNTLTELSPSGTNVAGSPYTGGLASPSAVMIDGLGSIWVANAGSNSVSKFSSNGTVLSGAGFMGSGLSAPTGLAVSVHP